MPHRVIQPKGADRNRSLGWLALWWIETLVVHGPGDVQGDPVQHGDEYSAFIVDSYALDGNGRRLVDSAFFSRPKGSDKSGLGARLALFEALGPCRFAGWAEGGETFEYLGHVYVYEAGEPMGRPVSVPYVRIMATEEGQTGNVYDTIHYNLDSGPLSELKAYGLDAGLTRILLPYGGEITPSTAGSASKDGGKETFVVFDETHLYSTPVLRQMYSTVTRNLVKRKKSAETWFLETTTMYQPGEESIAEGTYKLADAIDEARQDPSKPQPKRERILFDHRWADLEVEDFFDDTKLVAAVIEAYGEAMGWNDVEAVVDQIFDPRNTLEESRRYFLNALTAATNAWVTPQLLARVCRQDGVEPLVTGEEITLGFDGALTDDATALVGCRVSDGYLFPIHIEECPDGPEARTWQVDREAFDAHVRETFETYTVVGFFADPPYWQDSIESWEKDLGQGLRVQASGKSSIKWWTKLDAQMALAAQRLVVAMKTGETRMSDDRTLMRHVLNARKWKRRGGEVIGKEGKNSVRKIDAAMAAILAYEARAAFLARGAKPKATFVPRRAR